MSRRAMAQLGRELIDLAGDDQTADLDALRSILAPLDRHHQANQLRAIIEAFTARPARTLDQRLQAAVRTVLREASRR